MQIRRSVVALTLAYALTAGGAAGQESEVRQAVSETLSAWSAGDFATFAGFYHSTARGFFLDGGVLLEGIDPAALQAGYEAGVRAEFELRDLVVRMSGGVALTAGYLDGSLTLPGGVVRNGTWRYTETRIPDGGVWKVVQFHFSDLTATAR